MDKLLTIFNRLEVITKWGESHNPSLMFRLAADVFPIWKFLFADQTGLLTLSTVNGNASIAAALFFKCGYRDRGC